MAIFGCGWLGLPLAVSLIKKGQTVHGTTTTEAKLEILKNHGIQPFLIAVSQNGIVGNIGAFLKNCEILIINIPPKLRSGSGEPYFENMRALHASLAKSDIKKVIFVSSTSVYGDATGVVTEAILPEPVTESGKQLLASEALFMADPLLQTTVIRFGGLIGPDRHPITTLSGKQNLVGANSPVNLIHLNDCIGIVQATIAFGWWGETMNGVHPDHPKKKEYYTQIALKRNLQLPDFKEDGNEKSKLIVPYVLLNVKKYRFSTSIS